MELNPGQFRAAPVAGALGDKLRRELCNGFYQDFVSVTPGQFVLPSFYPAWHQRYQEFQVKHDDVWVVTYPKSGTTWTQELVWCLLHGLDTEEGKQGLMRRFPFFEYDSLMPEELEDGKEHDPNDPCLYGNTWRLLHSLAAPRTIKSHLHLPLLPQQLWSVKPKIVYVCRDPRDVCISYYFHSIKLDNYTGQLDDFVQLFLADMMNWSPFWQHTLEFWKRRHEPNILFIRFEDMKEDLPKIVRRVAAFLGVAVTEGEVARLADHCSFGSMSKNKAVNNENIVAPDSERAQGIKFMRKGKVGDWKNHLTKEQQEAFKTWTLSHLQHSDFPFYQDYD